MSINLFFRAFRYRNYRLFFAGQGLSLIGTWIQQVAVSWLVYRLTDSAFLLGIVAFASQTPVFIMSPIAGVIADRYDRWRLLFCTQTLSLLQAVILATLVLSGAVRTWHIIALSVFIGIVNAFDIPARQSFVIQMVETKEDLGNAIALNSAMFNGARFIGPSIAGILISTLGEGVCFLLNGLSYLAVIAALASMRVAPWTRQDNVNSIWRDLREGVSYIYHFKPMRAILVLLGVVGLAGSPYLVLMPVYAKDVLHGGPHTFGFLMSAPGVGALTSTLYLASRKNILGFGRMIPLSTTICSLGIAAFALSQNLTLSLLFLFLAGFGMMTQIASSNTILQTIVDEDKRGRVMSLFSMSVVGTMPFGGLLAGALAGGIGVRNTLLIGAAVCIGSAGVFASRLRHLQALVRPVYTRMGIIPEAATRIQSATESTKALEKH